jgi:hypothetical protein
MIDLGKLLLPQIPQISADEFASSAKSAGHLNDNSSFTDE